MIDPSKSFLLDLNFRTALLESLNWDETQFDSLLQYLQDNLRLTVETPGELLKGVKDTYGIAAFNIIKKMFVDEYILNRIQQPGKDHEH